MIARLAHRSYLKGYNDAIRASWCLKSRVNRLIVQHFVSANIKEHIKSGRFPSQRASNVESASMSWRHHGSLKTFVTRLFIVSDLCLPCVLYMNVSQHRQPDCLFNNFFSLTTQKGTALVVLCKRNSQVTQGATDEENVPWHDVIYPESIATVGITQFIFRMTESLFFLQRPCLFTCLCTESINILTET